jgi:hypothetical protein
VSKACFAEPYMQPFGDVDLLCEDHISTTAHWYERGDIATRLLRDMIFLTDPWHVSITKSAEYYMAMAAWCIIEVPDVNHAIHPYTCFLPLRSQDYNRRRAGVQTQANAPLNATDLVHVGRPNGKWDSPVIWRQRTQGPLKGWYAALALSKRAFVTYSETEARIASSETRLVRVSLPPGAKVKTVEMIPHNGCKRTWPGRVITTETGETMEMKVEDCGGKAMYYRITYLLP